MPRLACPSPEELSAFLLGDLCEATLTEIAVHLEACQLCESAAQKLDRVTDPVVVAYRRSAQNGPTITAAPPAQVGEYDVIQEIGRGGMGVVYKARHRRLGRTVALKMLLRGAFADPEERSRFRAEAEAVARLEHPHIVHLYEVGEYDSGDGQSRPYFTLEFVDGESLAARMGRRPQAPRQAAAWVENLARAAHYAHERGVVHRDLKPSNILLTVDGVPKLCDFGVAKLMTGSDVKTISGAVLGTIEYMSPEQAAGESTVGPPADIYALGAILYTALTGRPPFQGANTLRTLEQVQSQDPVAPRLLVPLVPRDLNTICLKCLEKKPASRYPSAVALADDLHRFLAGEPIVARPVSKWERTWKWTRRRPAMAALLALSLLVLVVGFPGATVLWLRADRERAAANEARDQLEGAVYAGHIALADHAYEDNDVESARGLLARCAPAPGRPDRRHWEWAYLDRLSHGDLFPGMGHENKDSGWVFGLAFASDDRSLISVSGLPGGALAGHPANAAEVTPGEIKVWDAGTGKSIAELGGQSGAVVSVAVSPNGQWLATGSAGGEVCLWDGKTLASRGRIPVAKDGAALVFSPDSRLLIVRNHRALVVWDLAEGRRRFSVPGEWSSYQASLAVAPDGRIAFGAMLDGRAVIRIVDPQTGKDIGPPIRDVDTLALAFSPDGRFLAVATAAGHRIQVSDAAGTKLLRQLAGHTNDIAALAFCPDGRLASGSDDRTVRLWNPETGAELFQFRGHALGIQSLAVSPDGRRLAAGDKTGAIKLWDLTHDPRGVAFKAVSVAGEYLDHLGFSADGQSLIVVSDRSDEGLDGHNIARWDPATGKLQGRKGLGRWVESELWHRTYAISGDGRLVAGPDWKDRQTVNLFDTATGNRIAAVRGEKPGINGVALDRTGDRVAISRWSVEGSELTAELLVAAVPDGQEVFRPALPPYHIVGSPALSPDGRRLACIVRAVRVKGQTVVPDSATAIYVWELAGGDPLILEGRFDGYATCVVFSPDGKRVAAAGGDSTVRVWDVVTGRVLFAPVQESRASTGLAFSPDGRRLAGAATDGTVRLWDAHRGERLLTLRGLGPPGSGHYGYTARVAFSPDGARLAANDWDGTVTIWKAGPSP